MSQAVLTDIDNRGVARVTLNRPDIHNAFDDALIGELTAVFKGIAADSRVRAALLTGSGRSFSAGADLNWMKRMAGYSHEENLADASALAALMRVMNSLSVPLIGLVQGAAYGGGVGLVACCDIAIGTERAAFCLSEVKLGLIPAVISPYVIAAIGERSARRYFLTAEVIDAAEALRIGLLHEVVADEAALADRGEMLIKALLKNGPKSVSAAKELIAAVAGKPVDAGLIADTAGRIAAQRASDEGKEGVAAFLAKRKPDWMVNG